jgi:hypothetical protein
MNLKRVLESRFSPVFFFLCWFLFYLIISFFRNSTADENIYLGDAITISNLLKDGIWFGNFGVGMHGFLNKFVIGITFIFTGYSIFIATLSNIFFALGSGVIFRKLLIKHFNIPTIYSYLSVTLLFTNVPFFIYTPTFYRDIIALFFVLLVVYFILEKKNDWWIGLLMLLLLDSKEHVFFMIGAAVLIWIFIFSIFQHKKDLQAFLKTYIFKATKILLPSLVYLLLMFFTSILPLNIYNANLLGLVEHGISPAVVNLAPENATHNRDLETNTEKIKSMPKFQVREDMGESLKVFLSIMNLLLSYIGKVLYPRTFSFLSIPFIIFIPALFSAYKYFREKLKRQQDSEQLLIPILFFFSMFIYIFHASIPRYLLSVAPFIYLFWIVFLVDLKVGDIVIKRVFLVTLLFSLGGLYFEYSFIWIKLIFLVFIFILYFLIIFINSRRNTILKYSLILICCFFALGTGFLSSYLYGQIGQSLRYGYNREYNKIISLIEKKDVIWINDIGSDKLPFILRGEDLGDPEWRWSLQSWIPKKGMLKKNQDFNTYNFYWKDVEDFKERIMENRIEKIVYIKLEENSEKGSLLLQDRLEILLDTEWLELEKEIEMKNKVVYLFNVDEILYD